MRPDLGVTDMATVASSVAERARVLEAHYRFPSLRLDDFSPAEIEALARFTELCRAKAGGTIFKEGGPGAYMGFIASGEVEIRKDDGRGAERVLATFSEGKLLGEMALVDGERRSATAVAVTDTTLLVLTTSAFDQMLSETPRLGVKLAMSLARLLSARLRMTSGRLVDHLER